MKAERRTNRTNDNDLAYRSKRKHGRHDFNIDCGGIARGDSCFCEYGDISHAARIAEPLLGRGIRKLERLEIHRNTQGYVIFARVVRPGTS